MDPLVPRGLRGVSQGQTLIPEAQTWPGLLADAMQDTICWLGPSTENKDGILHVGPWLWEELLGPVE